MPAFPSASHAKPSEPCVASTATQSAATAGAAHQRRISTPASAPNTPRCSALATQNSRNTRPARRVAQPAVEGEHELNPVADAEPVDHARAPAEQEAARPARLARHRHQQRRQRHRREPDDGEFRESENQQRRRSQRQQPVQHDSRCAASATSPSLTRSAM